MQEDKGLKHVRTTMIGIAAPLAALEVAALAHWIFRKDWRLYAGVEAVAIPTAALLLRYYRNRVAYICPNCDSAFQPELKEWLLARQNGDARELTCSHCGKKGPATEISIDRLTELDMAASGMLAEV